MVSESRGLSKTEQASGKSRARKPAPASPSPAPAGAGLMELPIEQIEVGPNPRVLIDEKGIRELSASLKQHGMLQPVRVRPVGTDRYQVVLGSRRIAAARHAHLKTVPAVIASPDDEATAVQQLVENLQRQDLDPIDEASAYQQMLGADPKLTQEAMGKIVGRSQPYIANALRLLETPPEVQQALQSGKLSTSHVKAIASLPPEKQIELAKEVVEKRLPTGQVEYRVAQLKEYAKTEERNAKWRAEEVDAYLKLIAKVPTDTLVVVRSGSLVETLSERSQREVQVFDHKAHRVAPDWKCSCKMVIVDTYGGASRPVCGVPEHGEDFRKEQAKARKEIASANAKLTDQTRRKLRQSFVQESDDGLNVDGQRAVLYTLLVSMSTWQGSPEAASLVKRYGGRLSADNRDWSELWETISGMTLKDVASEISTLMAREIVPNVWSDDEYGQLRHAGFRRWAVDQFGLEKSAVWGSKDPETLAVDEQPEPEQPEPGGPVEEAVPA